MLGEKSGFQTQARVTSKSPSEEVVFHSHAVQKVTCCLKLGPFGIWERSVRDEEAKRFYID